MNLKRGYFFCTQIPYLETPYFNANKAKKEQTELLSCFGEDYAKSEFCQVGIV